MKPAAFDLMRPSSIEDAIAILSRYRGVSKIIAGGQSLVPLMNLRMSAPDVLVDISGLSALTGISERGGDLVIGAGVKQSRLLHDPLVAKFAPLLAAAAVHIGHVQTRARGTVGGSLAHADPAAEISTVVTALEANIAVRGPRGERTIQAEAFFVSALTTALDDDEILCEIRIPKPQPLVGSVFRELARRHGDFAIVSAAVQVARIASDRISVNAAMGGIAERPHRCMTLQAVTTRPSDRAAVERVVDKELASVQPLHDIHASAGYRRALARVLLADCLAEAFAHD